MSAWTARGKVDLRCSVLDYRMLHDPVAISNTIEKLVRVRVCEYWALDGANCRQAQREHLILS